MKRLVYLDQLVFQWLAQRLADKNSQGFFYFFKWVSKTGDGYLYLLLAAVLFYFDSEHGNVFFYTALLAYTLEIPIYLTLKMLFKRRRPLELLKQFDSIIIPSDKFSLPSGHTAAAFLMATIVSHFYPSLTLFAFLWACSVGLSRIVLRVHFPFDVIVGAGLGMCLAFTSIHLLG